MEPQTKIQRYVRFEISGRVAYGWWRDGTIEELKGSIYGAATPTGRTFRSEQVRLLERACGVALFIRVGRGLRPTEAAHALTPHAQRAIDASEQAIAAARAVRDLLTGIVRLGVFGTMRYYVGADLVASILTRYPELRVEIVGQNSAATIELVRSGDVEAGIVALPVDDAQLSVRPLFRDEILYVTADPTRAASPVTAERLVRARLVLPWASWAEADSTRVDDRLIEWHAFLQP